SSHRTSRFDTPGLQKISVAALNNTASDPAIPPVIEPKMSARFAWRSPREIRYVTVNITTPIPSAVSHRGREGCATPACGRPKTTITATATVSSARSEEHTSELQSRFDLVCRL